MENITIEPTKDLLKSCNRCKTNILFNDLFYHSTMYYDIFMKKIPIFSQTKYNKFSNWTEFGDSRHDFSIIFQF